MSDASNTNVWEPGKPETRHVERDGVWVWKLRCPQCGHWAELDAEQAHGRVSTLHDVPGCGFHETRNWIAEVGRRP